MAKKSLRRRLSPRALIISLIVLGGLAYSLYRVVPRQRADIFVVDTLTYGETTLTGVVQKDTSKDQKGNYYLSMSDGKIIMLDAQGVDDLIGESVSVSGYLTPQETESSLPYMAVSSISSL